MNSIETTGSALNGSAGCEKRGLAIDVRSIFALGTEAQIERVTRPSIGVSSGGACVEPPVDGTHVGFDGLNVGTSDRESTARLSALTNDGKTRVSVARRSEARRRSAVGEL
jgi:hypothetical protein